MPDKQICNRSKDTRWKPGQSGNPKGRPKKDVCLTSLVKKQLDEVPEIMISGKPNDKTWRELIVTAWLVAAYKGNPTYFRELMDRLEGKVPMPITGSGGEPLLPEPMQLILANGTVIKSPRNGHEIGEIKAGGNGH